MTGILGIDISGGKFTAFLLGADAPRPANFVEAVRSAETFDVKSNRSDLEAVLSLDFDIVALEPSGYHYERLFVHWFTQAGKEIRYIQGRQINAYRSLVGVQNKTDAIDAFLIAWYCRDNLDSLKLFQPVKPLQDLRVLWLQRDGLSKTCSRLVNRLRQQLESEFPEVARTVMLRDWGEQPHGLYAWFAGEARSARWDKKLYGGRVRARLADGSRQEQDRPGTIGLGVSDYTRFLGKQIYETQLEQLRLENLISAQLDEFPEYRRAFAAIGLSDQVSAIWLSRIYPIERFLEDGRPKIIYRNGNSRNQSLAEFKACLGAGLFEYKSGIRTGEVDRSRSWRNFHEGKPVFTPTGDRYCRKSYFRWHLCRVETGQLDSPHADRILAKRDELKAIGKNLYQRAGNIHGLCARILFKELISQ